jgi:hypothetical protein
MKKGYNASTRQSTLQSLLRTPIRQYAHCVNPIAQATDRLPVHATCSVLRKNRSIGLRLRKSTSLLTRSRTKEARESYSAPSTRDLRTFKIPLRA